MIKALRLGRMTVLLAALAIGGATTALGDEAPVAASAPPLVRTAAGADPAAITAARDQYRGDLGGGTTAGANGSFGGLRREVNWDGVPDTAASPNAFPPAFFNTNSPRGVVFSTPGTGFQVSAVTGQPAGVRFANLNQTYPTIFQTFSAQRLFAPIGSNVTTVTFFAPGTTRPATVAGFGAVFNDVDVADATAIEFYGIGNQLLGRYAAPAASNGLSFVGVSFPDQRVASVRITTGSAALGPNDETWSDVVAMDDFIYSEPLALNQLWTPLLTR